MSGWDVYVIDRSLTGIKVGLDARDSRRLGSDLLFANELGEQGIFCLVYYP